MITTELRRFIQRDPLEYVDGMNAGAYVNSTPIIAIDAFGLSGACDPCECGNGTLYTVKLIVDEPDSPFTSGHAYVELKSVTPSETVVESTETKGHYPAKGTSGAIASQLSGDTPGIIKNDLPRYNAGKADIEKKWCVSKAQFERAKKKFKDDSATPPNWDANGYNCVDWALDVLEEAGVPTEDLGGKDGYPSDTAKALKEVGGTKPATNKSK